MTPLSRTALYQDPWYLRGNLNQLEILLKFTWQLHLRSTTHIQTTDNEAVYTFVEMTSFKTDCSTNVRSTKVKDQFSSH